MKIIRFPICCFVSRKSREMLVFRKLWTMSVKPQGSLSVCPTLSNAALVGQRQPLRLGCCQKYTEEEEEETHNSIKYKKTSGATIKSRFHYHLCEFLKKQLKSIIWNKDVWNKFNYSNTRTRSKCSSCHWWVVTHAVADVQIGRECWNHTDCYILNRV